MKRRLYVFVASLWLASTSLGAGLEFARDAQALHDLGLFRFEQIVPNTRQAWVVLKITPGKFSGALSQGGGRINPKTGKMEFLTDSTGSLWIEEASATVLATLAGEPTQQEYDIYQSFQQDYFLHKSGVTAGRYRPFLKGGVAICCVNEDIPDHDPAKFSPLYLIPQDWVPFVKPAFKYFKANSGLFDSNRVQTTQHHLEQLLVGKNPLLAAVACRVLAETGKLNTDKFIKNDLAEATGLRQAVFVRYALVYATPEEADKVSKALEEIIDQAGSTQQLQPFALGAVYAASVAKNPEIHREDTGSLILQHKEESKVRVKASLRVLQHLQEKHEKLTSGTAADEYILTALREGAYLSPYPNPTK
jgi:hypothetical protein